MRRRGRLVSLVVLAAAEFVLETAIERGSSGETGYAENSELEPTPGTMPA